MLVLTRRVDGSIIIGNPKKPEECIEITVVEVRGDQVRIGVSAPKEVSVHRKEVYLTIQQENRAASKTNTADVPAFDAPALPAKR